MKCIKIAITGGTGFLGQHLVASLSDHDVTIFDTKKDNVFNEASLKEFVSGKDLIIHLAGANRGEPRDLFQTNVLGTLALTGAIAKYAPSASLFFASSVQVYLKDSLYGISKKHAEELLSYFQKKHGLRVTIFRFTNLYGLGSKPFYNSVIATFLYQAAQNKQITIHGSGKTRRDYLHVQDAVSAIVKAIPLRNQELRTFDIASGRKYSLNEVVWTIEDVLGRTVKVAYVAQKKEPIWRFRTRSGHAMVQLGWKPTVTLRKGIAMSLPE